MALSLDDIKFQEVRGAMSAFNDARLVKVAREDFDPLCSIIADNLSDRWDLNEIAQVTDAVLAKTAAYDDTVPYRAAIGDLTLMKIAGEIDDRTYENEVDYLLKAAEEGKAEEKSNVIKRGYQGAKQKILDTVGKIKNSEHWKKHQGAYKTVGKVGAGTGLVGLGVLGKSLYDKYK